MTIRLLILLCIIGSVVAASEGYSNKLFPLHHGHISALDEAKQRISVEPVPSETESAERFVEWMKWNDVIIKGWLKDVGLELSSGSLAVYDADHGWLLLRGLPDEHSLAEALLEPLGSQSHKTEVQWYLDVIAAPSLKCIEIMEKAAATDATIVKDELLEHGKSTQSLSGQASPGSKVEVSSRPTEPHGYSFTLDSVINTDRKIIDFNISIEQRSVRQFRMSTALCGHTGSTQLLGVWHPETDKATMHMAFISVSLVRPDKRPHSRALALMEKYGEAAIPTPKTLPPGSELPTGMIRRRFLIPPDFLSRPEPRDPFDSGLQPRKTAMKLLEDQGVPFPPGAKCQFITFTSQIVAINTPENMKLIEGFVKTLNRPAPNYVAMQVYALEAPGNKVRDWERSAAGGSDHSKVFSEIMSELKNQSATLVETAFISTKPGSWATLASGLPTKLSTPERRSEQSIKDAELRGLSLKLAAVTGTNKVIDCNYEIDVEEHSTTSTVQLTDGVPRLAATWSGSGDKMRMLFFVPTIIFVAPPPETN